MSGYFARVAALAFGSGSALRPAATVRYGAAVFGGSAPPLGATATKLDASVTELEQSVLHLDANARQPRPAARTVHDRARELRSGARGGVSEATDANEAVVANGAAYDRGDGAGAPALQLLDEREPARYARAPEVRAAPGEPFDGPARTARLLPLDDGSGARERSHAAEAPGSRARAAVRSSRVARADTAQGIADEPADVYVHIGRIDVRAVAAPERRPPAAHSELRKPSLEAHLRARDGGRA